MTRRTQRNIIIKNSSISMVYISPLKMFFCIAMLTFLWFSFMPLNPSMNTTITYIITFPIIIMFIANLREFFTFIPSNLPFFKFSDRRYSFIFKRNSSAFIRTISGNILAMFWNIKFYFANFAFKIFSPSLFRNTFHSLPITGIRTIFTRCCFLYYEKLLTIEAFIHKYRLPYCWINCKRYFLLNNDICCSTYTVDRQ